MTNRLESGSKPVTWNVRVNEKNYEVDLLHPDNRIVKTTDIIVKKLLQQHQRRVEKIVIKAFKDKHFSSIHTDYIITEKFKQAGPSLIKLSNLILGINYSSNENSGTDSLSSSSDINPHSSPKSNQKTSNISLNDLASTDDPDELDSESKTNSMVELEFSENDSSVNDSEDELDTSDSSYKTCKSDSETESNISDSETKSHSEEITSLEGQMTIKRFKTQQEYDDFVTQKAIEFSRLSIDEILEYIEKARQELNAGEPGYHKELLRDLDYDKSSMVKGFSEIIAIYKAAIQIQVRLFSLDSGLHSGHNKKADEILQSTQE